MKTLTTRILLGLVAWPCLVGIAGAASLDEKASAEIRTRAGDEPIVQELPGEILIERLDERRQLRHRMRER